MILLSKKLSRPFKFPHHHHHHHHNPTALSSPLRNFRSKISIFIAQSFSKPDPAYRKCFDLINLTNKSLAEMAIELDHPITRWGPKLTHQYLSFTLTLLDLLNFINSSLSHLAHAKLSLLHTLNLIQNPPSSARHLKKIAGKKILSTNFKFDDGATAVDDPPCSDKDRVVLQALAVSMRIQVLALGFVLSCLSGDGEACVELRKRVGGFDGDDLVKEVESRLLCREAMEMEEVREVNIGMERVGDVKGLRARLEVLGNSIVWIDKEANNLFSQVLGTRNKLIDSIRFTLHN